MEDFDFLTIGVTTRDTETNAATKTRYEANADTNAYTDAEKAKLAGLNAAAYATSAQGAKADTALQPSGSLTSGQYLKSGGGALVTGQTDVPWNDISGKPAIPAISGTPALGQIAVFTSSTTLAGQTGLNWADVTGRPTTRAGYGITDAEPLMVPSESASAAITLADVDDRKHRHLTHATPAITIPTGLTVGKAWSFSGDNPFTVTAAVGVTMAPSSPRTVGAAPKAVTILIVATNKAVLIGDAT